MNAIRALIADQVADVRFSRRVLAAALVGKGPAKADLEGEKAHQADCCRRIKLLFKARHDTKLDCYGWPEVWK